MSEELYYCNGGRGPMVARIVGRHKDGTLTLERAMSPNSKRWIEFTLHESFFNSKNCGWRKRAQHGVEATGAIAPSRKPKTQKRASASR